MKRWDGWGDQAINYPITGSSVAYLERLLGTSNPQSPVSLQSILPRLPKPRLPKHRMVTSDPTTRLLHARGQSFPDWLELHSPTMSSFPDGVAYPMTSKDVQELIRYAVRHGVHIIPYGGGTSVAGQVDSIREKAPIISIDMSRMNKLINFEPETLLATFGAGIIGPDLEAQLRAHGYMLGHFPQSFEYSTLGGWISTRSSGQQSLRYGRIEKLFAGGRIETPQGSLVLPTFPASAAGPDLREIVLGSEGRLGVITEATVRISPIPEREEFHAVFFPGFHQGIQAIQEILRAGLSLNMLRLSTSGETSTTLALAGHERLIGALERLLAIRGLGDEKCMLLLGFCGNSSLLRLNRSDALGITSRLGGVHVGKAFGDQWHKNRFRTPYLRNTLWGMGYGVDTLETASDWTKIPHMVEQIETALHASMSAFGEKVHVFTHLSHVYPYGSSVYTTFIFRLAKDPGETLTRWQAMKLAASQAIVALGGTISHHHGVGTDHLPYLVSEKGALGMNAMIGIYRQFDPKGIMNPGKLVA